MTDSEETLYTGYVYMIYNDVNDKVYIGETLQKLQLDLNSIFRKPLMKIESMMGIYLGLLESTEKSISL